MDKPPEEIYRYMIEKVLVYDDKEPSNPLYNKYIREDIFEKMRLSAYAGAHARIMANLNKEKKWVILK